MNLKYLATAALATLSLSAAAHTVLLSENFDGDWSESFPLTIDGDHFPTLSNYNPLFMDGNGRTQPWWPGKDASAHTDRFIMSHSAYQNQGASKDFMISKPITIPSEGFTLTFEAQSINLRGGLHTLSDLHLFILDQLPTEQTLPDASQAVKVWEKVGYGTDADLFHDGADCTLSFPLDAYIGKTIYLAFANLNADKDVLAIDNVLVQRLDNAELSATAPRYCENNTFPLQLALKNTGTEALGKYEILVEGGSYKTVFSGAGFAAGETLNFNADIPVLGDETINWTVSAKIDGQKELNASGTTTGLLFTPQRRVLMEETTGTWCGNCPLGIYTIEKMLDDELLKDKVIPVAVHINDASNSEPMYCPAVADEMGINLAPMFTLDRASNLIGFTDLDASSYDPTNTYTAAGAVLQRANQLSLVDVKITDVAHEAGEIVVTAQIKPAVTLDGTTHGLGIILTEDNVGIDGMLELSRVDQRKLYAEWLQQNYYKGFEADDDMNCWSLLPKEVAGMRYQHVARATDDYWGRNNTLPAQLKGGETYTVTRRVKLPDTYTTNKDGIMHTPAIRPEHINAIAYVINNQTYDILNSDEKAVAQHEHYDSKQLYAEISGVECIEAPEAMGAAEYFTVEGLRVNSPEKGRIYIVRTGSKTSKIVY